MTCPKCSHLENELLQKNSQITHYESKIRDTVNAYKILETQKNSLEVALRVLSDSEKIPDESICKEDQVEGTSHESINPLDDSFSQELVEVDNPPIKPKSQLEALREAISTLTLTNKRKEIEFKRDRRTLLDAKEEAQKRVAELENKLDQQLQKTKSQNLRRLREQLAESQSVLERTMTENGMILAEMQQQYGREKRRSENLEKQITEMSQRLASKDDLLKRAELQLKELPKLERELCSLRKKAELTPSVCVILDELANVKTNSEQEIANHSTRFAIQSAQLRERDSRIEQLEKRLQEIIEKYAEAEHKSNEFIEKSNKLEKELAENLLKLKKCEDGARKGNLPIHLLDTKNVENENLENLIEHFSALCKRINEFRPGIDIAALLPFGVSTSNRFQHQVEDSPSLTYSGEPNTDRKSPGLNGANSPEISRNTSSVSLSAVAFCDACLSSRRELELFKSRIGQLQFKLSTLEANHERTKKEHEDTADLLRERIIELETSQSKRYTQLTANARDKVAELEEELQKQRARMLEIVAEKDREIEFTKNSLAAFYARNYGPSLITDSQNNFPMDPLQQSTRKYSISSPINSPAFASSNNQHQLHQKSINVSSNRQIQSKGVIAEIGIDSTLDNVFGVSSEVGRSSPILLSQSHEQSDFSASHHSSLQNRRKSSRPLSFHLGGEGTLIAGAAARNIFYEQELCKREQEIGELRNVIRLLEMKVRDIEQAMLLKDVQYLQIIETLKEEIRILESRLSLVSSQTNLAYLRNIFVQFLNQSSANGRKHILKAIGAVLQLTPIEMCRVDRWTY